MRVSDYKPQYITDQQPPKDGTIITVPVTVMTQIYWDENLKCWVLVRPINIETFHGDIPKWKLPS